MKFTTSFAWQPQAQERILALFDTGGIVQTFVDSEYIKDVEKYTPFKAGALIKSATISTVIGGGLVIWRTPYARYLYYGKVMVGKAPKTVTGKDLVFHSGGLRGAKWHERWKAAEIKSFMVKVNNKVRTLT